MDMIPVLTIRHCKLLFCTVSTPVREAKGYIVCRMKCLCNAPARVRLRFKQPCGDPCVVNIKTRCRASDNHTGVDNKKEEP